MIACWRQRSSILAYRWGVLCFEVRDEAERPEYRNTFEYHRQAKAQEQLNHESMP
eukprot:gene3858-4825_t